MAPPTNSPSTNTRTAHPRGHGLRTIRDVVRHLPRARAQAHAVSTLNARYAPMGLFALRHSDAAQRATQRSGAADWAHGTRSQDPVASRGTSTNIALAGLQLVIGYQWLVSGVDKILLGNFPAQMGHLIAGQIGSGKLPGYFAVLLQALVVPNAPAFGYTIILGETLAGLGLIAAGLLALLRPLAEAHLSGRLWRVFARTDRLVTGLAPLAAAGAGLLGVSYYLLDGAPTLWFTPSLAYGGAVASGMVVALACLVLVAAQVVRLRPSR